ncbi:MAG TPA: Fe-S cluster assembly protein SufD [Longimicrobiales bacterium]|nr:Fe-S cluster assembly protein SufD [Longimicrobiales bacterium]
MAEVLTAVEGAAAYSREAVEKRSANEPHWLKSRRAEAWRAWEELPLPTTELEEWRYTEVSRLSWDQVTLADPAANTTSADAAHALLQGREASARVVQAGASIVSIELDEALAKKGVLLLDMAKAADEYGELIEKYLGTQAVPAKHGKFSALNGALWTAGIFLYVPRGVRIDAPIRVARYIDQPGLAYMPRTLIVAEDASSFGFVEEMSSPDMEGTTFVNGVVEVIAATSANVQYVAMQQWGRGVKHLSTQRTVAARDANLDSLIVNLGADVARVDLAASLEGPGSRSDMLGLYFGKGDQHFDHNTRQDHRTPHAQSDLLYKGALDDSAHAVFRGIIKVFPKAQRTDAYQTNRNLLLSREANSTSLPNLEIEADDVRCSHAATVGQLDAEELFYIMSRGIPRSIAERLVVFGFFGEVLERLPMPAVVEELRSAIEKKLV